MFDLTTPSSFGVHITPAQHTKHPLVEISYWNSQTLALAQAAVLVEGAPTSGAMGICEFRAQWPCIERLRARFNVLVSKSNEFAWLLPKEWRVWAIAYESEFGFGVRVEAFPGRVLTLVVVHLACDAAIRLTQQAALEGLDLFGAWVLGGDFNNENEDKALAEMGGLGG